MNNCIDQLSSIEVSKHHGHSSLYKTVMINLIVAVLAMNFLFTGCGKSPLPPPVGISFRDSVVGVGKVIQIYNKSANHLYNVKVIGRNFEEVSSGSVRATSDLAPYSTIEVGWLEFGGWTPASGETVEIYCDDYLTPKISVIP
jgi:hypothetical protein